MGETGRAAGGKARAAALTPDERRSAAQKAAKARWAAKNVPSVVSGSPDQPLHIGDVSIECYVLDDGTRVLTQASMLTALGRNRRAAGRTSDDPADLPPILQGKAIRPFVPNEIIADAQPVPFRLPNGARASGYRAELLPVICEVYLSARAANALPQNQQATARQAEILVRGLARVGIIALVDEATGYQEVRARDALAKILEAYVADELQPWVKTFDVDYYKETCRLRAVPFDPSSARHPSYFGHLTNNVVYKRLAPGLLEELKAQQAKDDKKRAGKLHQQLTPALGHPKLREHIASVVTVMKLSDDWDDFIAKLNRVHPIIDTSLPEPLWTDRESSTGL